MLKHPKCVNQIISDLMVKSIRISINLYWIYFHVSICIASHIMENVAHKF